jgi:glycosyltransferase involved in cell wall biosynthesis
MTGLPEKSQRTPRLSVILPARNEAAALGQVLEELQRSLAAVPAEVEVLVVDDASEDETPAIARQHGAILLRHQVPGGYGAALKTGIQAARAPSIAILDADGSYDPASILAMWRFLPQYDHVNGVRQSEQGRWPIARKLAKALLWTFAQWFSGRPARDLNCGIKVFKRLMALEYLWVMPDGFSASSSLTLAFLCTGRRVKYVPVPYRQRLGHSKFRPLRDTLRCVQAILKVLFHFQPFRLGVVVAAIALLGALAVIFLHAVP